MKIESVTIDTIDIGARHRAVNVDKVAELAESMAKVGLLQPITVNSPDTETINLVAGRHRLEAARKLGWEDIDAIFLEGDEVDCEMAEIAENLHRSELTVLERGEQIGRWVALAKQKEVLSQVGTKLEGRPESGNRKAARELNLPKNAVHRAVKIAGLSDEAKQVARETGQDDNQSALLQAAKAPIFQQAEVLRNRIAPQQKDWEDVEEEQKRRLMSAWNAASPAVKAWFKDEIDQPIMDRRFGT